MRTDWTGLKHGLLPPCLQLEVWSAMSRELILVPPMMSGASHYAHRRVLSLYKLAGEK